MEEGTIFKEGNVNPTSPQVNQAQNFPSQPPVPTPAPTTPVPGPSLNPPNQIPASPTIPPVEKVGSKGRLKKILKIFLGLAVILVILIVVVSFFTGGKNKKTGNVTLTYWGLWEDSRIMQGVINDFEKENPTIKVEYSKEDIKQYRQRLQTRIENGTGPDIFTFHNTWYPMISTDLTPIPNDVIAKNDFQNRFYKVTSLDLIKNGGVYGFSLSMDTLAMFVNTDKFQAGGYQIPKTWNDFLSVSSQLTAKDPDGKIETAGAAIGTYENVAHAPDITSLLFAQNGVDLTDITKSTKKVSDALDFYTAFGKGDQKIWDSTLDNSILAFSKGQVGMIFGYSWDYFTIKALNPDLNFQVVPVPQLSLDNPKNLASYWAAGVSSKSKNQEEALLFLKFLSKKETMEKLFTEESKTRFFGEPYSDVSLASLLQANQNIAVFVDQAKTAASSPFVDSTYDEGLNQKLDNYLKDSINSVLTGASLDTTVETLFKGYTQVIGQYGSSQ